jgi:hypothetical protein
MSQRKAKFEAPEVSPAIIAAVVTVLVLIVALIAWKVFFPEQQVMTKPLK